LTQAQLAERAGVSRQWIVTVEKGDTPGLAIGHIMRVLEALDATLAVRDDAGERS
ncbi:MAG: helix-turn-helix domain-containing protein, partial [Cellulomonadaceae bacterium]|nr:helix-turn-helix domain-containing protein [Cellulomonadaceae bacterium]